MIAFSPVLESPDTLIGSDGLAFTTMALIALGAYAGAKTIENRKQKQALEAQNQPTTTPAPTTPAAPGPVAPPAPPPSATTAASNDTGAARLAADKIKKKATAGGLPTMPRNLVGINPPKGVTMPKTLLGA
jgi:hypothetical protein